MISTMTGRRKREGSKLRDESPKLPRLNAEDAIASAKARVQTLAVKAQLKRNGDGSTATARTTSASDLMAKIQERKAKLQETLNKMPGNMFKPEPKESKPEGRGLNIAVHPLLLDTQPREESKQKTSSQRTAKARPQQNPYFDPTIAGPSSHDRRRTRGLAFNPQGKYIKRAEEERNQARLEALKKKIEERSKTAGLLDTDIVGGERQFKPDAPPEIEWWDESLLPGKSYIDGESLETSLATAITDLIQHPIEIDAPWEKHVSGEVRMHMTKREIKRKRKNERAEKYKETQDRIRLGLDPAPPPKIKPSNVMSVYTNEAIKDPTLMEMKARNEVEQRRLKHVEDNQARKLTPDQHYEKFVAKLDKEKSKGIFCAVFRIENLSDGRHKFLVNHNATKMHFTGITIFNPKFCLVVVEGGFLHIKKFVKLLLHRIRWTENAPPKPNAMANGEDTEPPPDLSKNKCMLVWHGQLKTNRFPRWMLKDAETEQDAKDILARNEAEHFWLEARCLEGDDTVV
jgi:U4/U6 small nuclear ribonucleoprotein PRP3